MADFYAFAHCSLKKENIHDLFLSYRNTFLKIPWAVSVSEMFGQNPRITALYSQKQTSAWQESNATMFSSL